MEDKDLFLLDFPNCPSSSSTTESEAATTLTTAIPEIPKIDPKIPATVLENSSCYSH